MVLRHYFLRKRDLNHGRTPSEGYFYFFRIMCRSEIRLEPGSPSALEPTQGPAGGQRLGCRDTRTSDKLVLLKNAIEAEILRNGKGALAIHAFNGGTGCGGDVPVPRPY